MWDLDKGAVGLCWVLMAVSATMPGQSGQQDGQGPPASTPFPNKPGAVLQWLPGREHHRASIPSPTRTLPPPRRSWQAQDSALLRTRGHNTSLSMNHDSRLLDEDGSACISFQKSDHRGLSVQMLRVTGFPAPSTCKCLLSLQRRWRKTD